MLTERTGKLLSAPFSLSSTSGNPHIKAKRRTMFNIVTFGFRCRPADRSHKAFLSLWWSLCCQFFNHTHNGPHIQLKGGNIRPESEQRVKNWTRLDVLR